LENKKVEFSVVIPSHNSGKWIKFALDSVFQQEYAPMEVFVIDDNSDDNLEDQIRDFDVQYFKVNFKNAAASRNHVKDLVKGNYIAFLDADDIWCKDHLSRVAELLAKNEFPSGYINYFDHLDLEGNRIERNCPWKFEGDFALMSDCDYASFYISYKYFVGMSACVVSTERFKQIGGFDVEFQKRHDVEMWWRLIHGQMCILDKHKSSLYRKNVPGSVSQNSHLTEFYKLKGLLKNSALYVKCKAYQTNLKKAAVTAMNHALLYGDLELVKSVRSLGAFSWGIKERLMFNTIGKIPPAYKLLYKVLR
jgi:glycosyltransferase involved in cell wall biosynthesis